MHKLTFYPLGNADSCKMDIADGRKLLFDYANCHSADEDDPRINLAEALREDLADGQRDWFDVVAFTHIDDDHIHGFSEFFYLQHAQKYQDEARIKIRELWVPAATIVEEGLTGEAGILRSEARYRLKQGQGIRVFSRPDRLKDWLENEGIRIEDRVGLVTDAGNLVPNYSKSKEGIEFFVHSPFTTRLNNDSVDRNECAIMLQATFDCEGVETKSLIIGDTTHDVLSDVANVTRYHGREDRLEWDIFSVPHHCSYLALSDKRGKEETIPSTEVQWLLNLGRDRGVLVCSSNPIPDDDDNPQPPHRQAANCYRDVARKINGEFKVTMEHPNARNPEPIVIVIDTHGVTVKKQLTGGGPTITSHSMPRVGRSQWISTMMP